jgi:hypothetical protein
MLGQFYKVSIVVYGMKFPNDRPTVNKVSSRLAEVLANGDKSYNPQAAVTIYYASARNQITANSQVLPSILAVINPLLAQAGGQHTGQFLAANAGNAPALRKALGCGSCVSSPYAAKQVDLIPFNVLAAMGSTMVGLIFVSMGQAIYTRLLMR